MTHHRVVIIGSGPAGFTAGLYASRAGLDTVIFEGQQPGGQLTITTDVENYPGYPNGIMGPEMMEEFRKQAHKFGSKSIYETITAVDFSARPFTLTSDRAAYTADAVIIATGASAKLLGTESEQYYWGAGISACATCDGFFFRGEKNIFVVGGGDTAMEEAIYLTNFAEKVTLLNRSEHFRASQIMLERAQKNPKIEIMTDTVVDEFMGETNEKGIKKLTGLNLKNTKTGEVSFRFGGGCFIAIGHEPNTAIFKGMLDMDDNGYLITKGRSTYTNIPGVFACGDAMDHIYRQAVTAAGTGCAAAIDAERWLAAAE